MIDASPIVPRPIHWAGTISLGMIWGTAFMGMSVALRDLSPLWVATGRLAIGGATLLLLETILRLLRGPRPQPPVPWRFILPIGVTAAALPFFLLTWGLQSVPSAFGGVSMAAVALFVLPLAHFLVPGERLTRHRILGVLSGFVGVIILIGPGAFAGPALETLPGRLACLGAAFCYATSSILTRRCPPIDPLRLATLMTLTGAALLLVVALLLEGIPAAPEGLPLLALLWIGVFPTGVANLIRVLIVRSAGPGFMSLTSYQVPVWAAIFGAVILHESLPPQMLLSLALILGGIAITRLPQRRPTQSG